MEQAEAIARWALKLGFTDLALETRHKLKVHLLDALGCGLGGLGTPEAKALRAEAQATGLSGACTLIGGGSTSLEKAAYYNGALMKLLSQGDVYYSEVEACSPAEVIAPVLAAAEMSNVGGRELLTSLAVAYHVRCRVPRSFSLAVAAGAGRALRLTRGQLTHALRFGPAPGMVAVHQTRLAQLGYTLPVSAVETQVKWTEEDGSGVLACSLRGVAGSAHAQAPLEAVLQLQESFDAPAALVQSVVAEMYRARDVNDVQVGREVARAVGCSPEVVLVEALRVLGRMYPEEVPCRVVITLYDGRVLVREVTSYPGFYSRPLSWDAAVVRFERLSGAGMPTQRLRQIESAVAGLEYLRVRDLAALLG